MAKTDLTAARLREILDYNPETGVFIWLVAQRPGNGGPAQPGKTAGCIKEGQYRVIRIDGRLYRANRLAWLFSVGEWPSDLIDHRNGNGQDDRLANLRVVNYSVNAQNQRRARSDSSTGLLGAGWDSARGKWRAQIKVNGKNRLIGRFGSPEEAHQAYLSAKRKLHEGCTI